MKKNKANSCQVTLKVLISELSDTEQIIKGEKGLYHSATIALLSVILLRKAVEVRRKREERRTRRPRNKASIDLPIHENNTLGED